MPQRSTVYELPQELREELNERLVSSGFQGYADLAEWLSERGFDISRSSLQRYGQGLQEDFDEAMGDVRKTTELAKAYVESDEDTQGSLVDATARIVQEQLLRITIALRKAEHEPEKAAKHMAQITHALADIGRMSIGQKKWAQEMLREKRQQIESRVDEAAEGNQPLTADAFKRMVREVYGG